MVAAVGLAVGWLVPPLAGAPGPGANPGVVATIRTAVLVAGVLLLAWISRSERWHEAGWLAYPVLVVIGMKLLLEDLARSPPASLFLAFALYGAALILVPRFRRREQHEPGASAAEPAATLLVGEDVHGKPRTG
jgi:predicted tellurium resistance membrane protein TerC